MKKFSLYILVAVGFILPALVLRFTALEPDPLFKALIFGVGLLAAGFMLSWGMEAAEQHVSQGLAVAVLALITVLPEYAVDIYYTWVAGQNPGSEYVGYAAANMTGANRLLVGIAWPLVVLLYWWRSGKKTINLSWENTVEITFLALPTIYSFFIVFRGDINLFDMVVLIGLFVAYLWRASKLPKDEAEAEEVEGPAASLVNLPISQQWLIIAGLAIFAGLVILLSAEPFAESLVAAGSELGIDRFLLIQWLAPIASEAPAFIIAILFVVNLRPTVGLGSLISDKINQWTLLVGMIPLVYSLSLGQPGALPLDARQREEFFLTAAQSLLAVALLLPLRLNLLSALSLLGLFLTQFIASFIFRNDEQATITVLTTIAWVYLGLAAVMFIWNRRYLLTYIRIGLLNQPIPEHEEEAEEKSMGQAAASSKTD